GVAMGLVDLNVRNVDANKKFFALLGGTSVKIDGTEVMKFPGVFFFLNTGKPAGGIQKNDVNPFAPHGGVCACPGDGEQSVLNHLGFVVRNYDEIIAKLKSGGVKMADL